MKKIVRQKAKMSNYKAQMTNVTASAGSRYGGKILNPNVKSVVLNFGLCHLFGIWILNFGFILFASPLFSQTEQENVQELIKKIQEQPSLLETSKKEQEERRRALPTPLDTTQITLIELLSTIEQMFAGNFSLSISKIIPQFGYDIFRGEVGIFAPLDQFPVPSEYILGPGDELIINIWGKIQETFKVAVDRDGKIILPKAGATYVWGLSFDEAKTLISKRLTQYYTNLELDVTMGRIRSIQIFVLGEVKQPGSYTISSLSTAFNALYSAGGPTKLGTLRNIVLIRNNREIVDLYDILLYGNKVSDYRLNSGDIIYIPTIGKVVGIAGSVKRPAIYELRKEETLQDLIKMAGDITPIGYLKRIQVERIEEHHRKTVMELEFKDLSEFEKVNFELKDGDFVLIAPILPKSYNYVSIIGNVERPGNYALKQNLKVSELIEKAEGILPGTYFERAEVSRFKADKTREIIPINLKSALSGDTINDIKLKEWDKVTIYAETDVFPDFYVQIDGAVFKPGSYKLTPNMTIEDLVFRAGGYLTTADPAYSELSRMNIGALPTVSALNLMDSTVKTMKLKPNDWLFVRENKKWTELPKITLTGEVVHPGIYIVQPDEQLSSVIKRAGGFTNRAFLPGAIFTRNAIREKQNMAIKRVSAADKKKLLFESVAQQTATGTVDTSVMKYREQLIDMVLQIAIPGRMQVNFQRLDSPEFDILIEDSDAVYIPEIPRTIPVVGCVYNSLGIIYKKGKSTNWYIAQAGGITKEGDRGEIYVIKASGKGQRGGKVERGDIIVVPQRLEARRPTGDIIKDVAQILYQLGFSALAIQGILK